MSDRPLVLILGVGINGAALARELALAGVSVTLVDVADMISGATAFSTRMIHGGLRYLEYGEFDLVRESLAERARLLRLAPQFVRPLELSIPVKRFWGGWWAAIGRFFGWRWWPAGGATPRGLALVAQGLWLYDKYAADPTLPPHRTNRVGAGGTPPVDASQYRWICSYYDAQVTYPERLVVAMLEDARSIAADVGADFQIFTYHQARLDGRRVRISPTGSDGPAVAEFEPAVIVNATGAWVDRTLASLQVEARRLIGGIKGSHIVTWHEGLRTALGDRGIYAEARDGRPVFILPLADAVLVGTTDESFSGDPADAVAREDEIAYLLEVTNSVLPQVGLSRTDVALHYSGVRPLPYVEPPGTAGSPGEPSRGLHATTAARLAAATQSPSAPDAITRRHWLESVDAAVPIYNVIGGKLTTARSLAEETTRTILERLHLPMGPNSRDRIIPGGEGYPADISALNDEQRRLADRFGMTIEQVRAVWTLVGTRAEKVLSEAVAPTLNSPPFQGGAGGGSSLASSPPLENLPGTPLPCGIARWVIRHEWARTLGDLVERRLMLLYHRRLTVACLRKLAELLVEEGKLAPGDIDREVASTIARLSNHYGKRVDNAEIC